LQVSSADLIGKDSNDEERTEWGQRRMGKGRENKRRERGEEREGLNERRNTEIENEYDEIVF